MAADFTGKTALVTPERSAAVLIARLGGDDTGAIWDVNATSAGAR